MVSAYNVPYGESHGSTDAWRVKYYTVELNQANDWGSIGLPKGQRKVTTTRFGESPTRVC